MAGLSRLCCMAMLGATLAGGQTQVHLQTRSKRPPAGSVTRATITTSSQLVQVPVTVLDAYGAPLRGLARDRFHLFEDGVEQNIQFFGQEDAPVSIGIVFDASKSMEPKLPQARQAVARLFENALPGDEYHLVEFNDSPRIVSNLTVNVAAVRHALDSVAARGWTALFDGVLLSAQLMRNAKNTRKALVILSDGQDNFSRYQETELRSFLREAGVVVYSIALSRGPLVNLDARYLRRISVETGGWCYSVGKLDKLGEAVRSISDAIRHQYLLSYSPSNPQTDGKYRKIGVKVLAAKSAGIGVSWRSGYYAPDAR